MARDRYDVFLSYASADRPAVLELAERLRARGVEPWLDAWHLIVGEPWQPAVEKALERSAAVAVCLGPGGSGPWQDAEMRTALDRQRQGRGTRVIPVLLPGAERGDEGQLPSFLVLNTWVEFHQGLDDEASLHRLVCGIRGIEPGPVPGEAPISGVAGAAPYRGLDVFRVEDAKFFFGREERVGQLLDKLRPGRAASRLLALVGPSGSGKSSLARAGLLAALARGEHIAGSDTWPLAVCRPGDHPLEDLALALGGTAAELPARLRGLATDPRMLHLTVRLLLGEAPPERRFVLLVDPLEPLFAPAVKEDERHAFLAGLLEAAAAAGGPTVVLLTLRSDFLGVASTDPDLAAALSGRVELVGPMSPAELRRAIERPAQLAGGELEGGLTDLLLRDVENQQGGLPLLEHALRELWERRQGRRMTLAAYEALGGVAGALDRHAGEVFGGFTAAEQEICRKVFLRLLQVGHSGIATRRFRTLDELVPAGSPVEERARIEGVVRQLTDARLLTAEGAEGVARVTLAHESLIAHWQTLGQWIKDDEAELRLRDQLGQALAKWQESRDPSDLYRGARLAQVEEWDQEHPGELDANEKEFLTASLAQRDEEGRRETRRARVLSLLSVGLAALAMVSIGSQVRLQRRANLDVALYLAGLATEVSQTEPQLGLLLAIEAARKAESGGEPRQPFVEGNLREILAHSGGQLLGSSPVSAVFTSANRRFVVTEDVDQQVFLWDLAVSDLTKTGRLILKLENDFDPNEIALSPDGRWLLTRDQRGECFLRDLHASGSSRPLGSVAWFGDVDPFSPGGRWLAVHDFRNVLLIDLPSWRVRTLPLPEPVKTVAFSPDGHLLATATREGATLLWDLQHVAAQIQPAFRVVPEGVGAVSLAFSADGRWLGAATVMQEGLVAKAWPIDAQGAPGKAFLLELCDLGAFPDSATVLFSPDGHRFLVGNNGRSCLWNWPGGAGSRPELLSRDGLSPAGFSPDSRWLAVENNLGQSALLHFSEQPESAQARRLTKLQGKPLTFSSDGRWVVTQVPGEPPLRWGLQQRDQPSEPRIELFPKKNFLALATDGRRAVVTSADDTADVKVWDLGANKPVAALTGFSDLSMRWAFSPDGTKIAGSGVDGRILVWPIAGRPGATVPTELRGHRDGITALVFSHDSHWLASGDATGVSRLWNLTGSDRSGIQLTTHSRGFVTALAFDGTADHVATAGADGILRIHRVDEVKQAVVPRLEHSRITALAFGPEGWLALAKVNGSVRLWQSEEKQFELENVGTEIGVLAFSRDGRWLASVGQEREVQLWPFEGMGTRRTPLSLTVPGDPSQNVVALAFSPEGYKLTAITDDGYLATWDLRLEKLLELACQTAGRNLSLAEWKKYLPAETYQERSPCPVLPSASGLPF